ncbi:hypothetical protein [Streptomyces flaveus]|uniref:Uncharacterized protein n=1 Tax=Streptomyces flaveus TaxID=66370 RepID=A0A917QRJ1_9ACTN|nr:hypothetical protein [Streptomyces flaveus]GGK65598.1 hypothetical protein GCM10010094_28340 [Streptomyces flaveus]
MSNSIATPSAVPCMADQGSKIRIKADEQRTTALAAALYIAQYAYGQAITSHNPAALLDDMCDSVAEVWDEITPKLPEKFAGSNLEFAETMRAAVADRLWAFAVVEHASTEGDDYRWVFTVMTDALRQGADPQKVRAEVPRVVERLRDWQAGATR